jgi:hypothetical protein
MASREWHIAREIDALIGKLARDEATDYDKVKLHELQRERVDRMMPRCLQRT